MRRWLSSLTVVTLFVGVCAVFVPSGAAAAPPTPLTLAASGPSSILVGSTSTITLTASNGGSSPLYNASLRAVLPLGVTYTGPTSPSDLGSPTISGDGTTTPETLVWSDCFDLQPAASDTLTFTVTPDPATYRVGTSIDVASEVYASSDPRYVPKFAADGTPVSDPRVSGAAAAPVSTDVSAITVSKDEPSPESELLRGVHDQSTVYTLTVTNNPYAATNSVTVTDYLPADQEFLGCGDIDNTPGGAVEYPGAPPLSAVPDLTSNCPTPDSVDTVVDPVTQAGPQTGVFTVVTWTIGNLAPGASRIVTYRAGVPLRENVAFPAGTPTTGVQAANLANNTGPATRQSGSGAASTNYVDASGTYTGPVADGSNGTVTASASKTVTIHDVRIHKSVSPATFHSGGVATYRLTVDTGEYEDASDIRITDVLPNGVCPLDDVANYAPASPDNSDCAPSPSYAPSDAYASVTEQAGVGTFTVDFTPIAALTHDSSTTISYQGRMRTVYTDGPLQGEPTSAGDSFTNRAVQTSDTDPRTDTPTGVDTGTKTVTDPTSANQKTGGPTLTKEIGERAPGMDCSTATYRGLVSPVPPELTFALGDRVCFRITVAVSGDADARNPVVTDFLPSNLAYEANSMVAGPADTVPAGEFGFDESGATSNDQLVWTLGHATGHGQREVTKGEVFQAVFSATVTGVATGPLPDKQGNLAKYRQVDSAGAALSLRDGVNFAVAPASIAIAKGVQSVNATTFVPPKDGVTVREGDQVTYSVDVSNTSDATTAPPAATITNPQVWDVLPRGIACADVSLIQDAGVCTDPGDAGHPTFTGSTTHSSIVWTGGVTIAPGATHSYAYAVTVPAGTSVADDLVNTAYVRSYDAATDTGATVTHYPAANIDPNLPSGAVPDPNPASDPSDVRTPTTAVTKKVVSAIAETNNAGQETPPGAASTQAVPGESVTFTVTARIPAGTTAYSGALVDTLPAGLAYDSSSADFAPDASSPSYGALPAGTSFDGQLTVSLGSTYDNTTTTDQLFRLVVTAHVDAADTTHNAAGRTDTNTAAFTSAAGPDGGPTPARQSATAGVAIVEPAPTLSKSNDAPPPATVSAGTTVTYTLTAKNAAGRPPLHDGWVVDCLPGTLTFSLFTAIPAGTTATTKPGANGASSTATACATGTTEIDWNVGDLAPGSTLALGYQATVNPGAAGSVSYTNTAVLTGSSLAGARSVPTDPGAALGRTYAKSASSTVTVTPAGVTKTVTPSTPTVGDTVTYTVTVSVPANVDFYNLSLVDTLPTGINPASTPLTATATCAYPDASPCGLSTATPLTSSGRTVGWLLGDAASDARVRTVTLTYQATVADVAAAHAGAALTNSATVVWDTAPGSAPTSAGATWDRSGGSASATVTVREPNLTITKGVSTTRPEPGSAFTYTVTVTNANTASTSSAYNVTVTDAVPAGVVVQLIGNGGTITGADPTTGAGGTISWTLAGPLARNAAQQLTYQATLAPSSTLTGAGLTNTATLTGYDSLAAGGRHYAPNSTATATVTPLFPALSATKAASDGSTTYLGAHYRWSVTVRDATGAGSAYAVGATDVLPDNWTFDAGSATVSVNGAAAVPVRQGVPGVSTVGAVQTLTFDDLADLGPGQSMVISYTATPGPGVVDDPGVGHSVAQTNTATPTGTDSTGATGNASGSYSGGPATAVTHIDSADVTMAKGVGVAPVAGQDGTWTLTVGNSGPDTAVGPFTVSDPFTGMPAGITLVGASGTGWSCTSAPISCTRSNAGDTLAVGATFPVITVRYAVAADVSDATSVSNTASVTARTYDPDLTNNTDTHTTQVRAVADLGLFKSLVDPSVVPGSVATYTVSVTNYGPSVSAGPIRVDDSLPPGSTFVSATGSGWSCAASGGTVSCTRSAALPPGSAAPDIAVKVAVPADQSVTVVNTATVTPSTAEPNPDVHPDSDTVRTSPSPSADVAIDKILADPPVVAGGVAHYTITVTNNGPSDAQQVVVTDRLPALLSYRSASGTGTEWSCSASGQDVTCDHSGALAAGATTSFTLAVDVAQQYSGTVSNTAHVGSTTPDPDPSNNSSTADSGVTDQADLSIVKTHTGTAVAGSTVPFTLQVHNHGPSDENGDVTVTDPLPTGTSFVSASGTGWSCAAASGTVTCTGATNLAAGTDAPPITVVLGIDPDVGPVTLSNVAHVSGTLPDPDPTNDSSTDSVPVTVDSDVTLTKTLDDSNPVAAGSQAHFTLTVRNAGPSDASTVLVTDTLPAHLTFASASGTGWTCAHTGQVINCSRAAVAAVPPGRATPPISVVADTDPSTPDGTTVQNVASVSTGSPSTLHQPGPVDVTLVRSADLSLTKSASPTSVTAGTDVTWTVRVANAGPSDADGPLTVVDTLPGYESFVSSSGAAWTCTPGAPPTTPSATDQQTVTCVRAAAMPAGTSDATLQLVAHVDAGAPVGDEVNSATVSGPTADPRSGNNTGTGAVGVTRTGQLTITKTHSGNGVVGQNLPFVLGVHNTGPSVADQVVVVDELPAGLTYVSAQGTGWTCTDAAAKVTCTLAGTLDPNTDATPIIVVATVGAAAYPTVTNVATVHSDDPQLPGSDTANDPVDVDPLAQLSLTKQHRGTFAVGSDGTYRLTIRNTGPTASPGPLVVTDPLPAGLTYASATGAGWACTGGGSSLRCTYAGGLALGGTSQIAVTVHVGAAAYPKVVNTATVTGPGSDPASGSDTAPVEPLSKLEVDKTLGSYRNGVATYRIALRNLGPNPTASTATLVDPLPSGLTYLAASGTGWSCRVAGQVVTCTYAASIAVGDAPAVVVTADVTAPAGTPIVNVARGRVGGHGVEGVTTRGTSKRVRIVAGGPGGGTGGSGTGGSGTGGTGTGGGTAYTGSPIVAWTRVAFLLLITGAGVTAFGRRRRRI